MSTSENPMTLTLRMLTGNIYTIKGMYPSDTVLKLKERFRDIEGIPTDKIKLTYKNEVLEDAKVLSDYSISDGKSIHLTVILRGGNKKSRKSRKSRKTRKHRR
jgi:hypothetical protein